MFPLVLVIGGLVAYSLINQGKAAYNQLQYGVDKFDKVQFGWLTSTIDFTFTITNNTNVSASINGVDGLILLNGKQLGTFVTRTAFTIQPGATTKVQARATVQNTSFLRDLVNVISTGKTPETTFDGGISTTLLGRVPFKYTALMQRDFSFKKKS